MKFRNMIFLFIIGLILAAWFTKPGLEKFHRFYNIEKAPDGPPPVISYDDKFLYAMVNVNHYAPVNIKLKGTNRQVAVDVEKEKYIGLFGRFWKM